MPNQLLVVIDLRTYLVGALLRFKLTDLKEFFIKKPLRLSKREFLNAEQNVLE